MESDPILDRQFRGHKEAISALTFHPLNNQLTSSSLDHSLMLWNSGKHLRSFKFHGHSDAVLDISFNRTGKILASASRDKTVRLWVPMVTGETVDFKAHGQTIRSVHFSPCGTKLLTGSDDKSLKLWSVARRKFLMSFVDHKNWVRCARYSKDGAMIASCSDDRTIKLWDPDNGKMIHTYQERKGQGNYIAWHPSGTYLAVALSNGTVKLYDTRTHSLLQHYRVHDAAVTQLAFHPDKNFLLTCSLDSHIKILDLLEGAPIYTLSGHENGVSAVAFSADGEYFASGGEDRQVMVWKTNFINHLDKENTPLDELYHVEVEGNDHKNISEAQRAKPTNCTQSDTQASQETIILTNRKKSPVEEEIVHLQPISNSSKNTYIQTFCPRDEFYFEEMESEFQIPRIPPSPQEVSIPNIPLLNLKKSSGIGVISLENSQRCYTDGKVEWVSKRNSNDLLSGSQPGAKKHRSNLSPMKVACQTNCSEKIVPALKAITDHLGALHNAVSLAEERISLLEDVIGQVKAL